MYASEVTDSKNFLKSRIDLSDQAITVEPDWKGQLPLCWTVDAW